MTPNALRLLGLAVATRDKDKGPNATKMAGFPHPAIESYLAKLVQAGVRAAVCEQVEDPRFAKGVVKRDIVRVVTLGTLTEDAFLEPQAANYLAAIVEVRGKLGLAWIELSTGRFSLACLSRTELVNEIARLTPSEVADLGDQRSRPLGPGAPRRVEALVIAAAAVVGLRGRTGPQGTQRAVRHDHAGRFRVDDECPEVQGAGG